MTEIEAHQEINVAVVAQSVYKNYGKLNVLQGTNLMVKKGHIYGLLGPSGCGKTTLLKCVIGRIRPKKGTIEVFQKIPGTVGSGIPGRLIGYMPQELALYNEFTIGQTMYFFGRVYRMKSVDIKDRIAFLLEFLDLPESSRRIDQLSGGQQRRVSFACALLHNPKILVLDEPTVGVDPVLRQRIWDHLLSISRTSHTTIIITTHYIEEARQADMVGLLRQGKMLVQGTPTDLLTSYNMEDLESVFLHLCVKEDGQTITDNIQTVDDEEPLVNSQSATDLRCAPTVKTVSSCNIGSTVMSYLPKPKNVSALVIKDLTLMRKRIIFLLFQFLLPAIQITLFSLCVGGKPYDLPVAVVNMDNGMWNGINIDLSHKYLKAIDHKTVTLYDEYTNLEQGKADVINGKRWAVLEFNQFFTRDLVIRFMNESVLDGSTINIWMDATNQQIAVTITEELTEAFERLSSIVSLPGHKNISSLPLKFNPAIYPPGRIDPKNQSFLNFMAPGIIISQIFFMATGLTTLSFVMEKKEGLLERTLVAGVNMLEIMIGHVLTQFITLAVQTAVLLVCALVIFKIENNGSLILIIILTLFSGFTGMALGFLISSVSRDEITATQLALASVYPMLLISGIIWPIEAMPQVLRYISQAMPLTFSAQAFRCVMGRGWSLLQYEVWRGFLVSLGWGWGLCIIAAIIIMVKSD